MLKYLIVQLDDTATSFCHYNNGKTDKHLIPLETLKKALFQAMKENLAVQFLYPDYKLPQEYKEAIFTISHIDIVSSLCEDKVLRDKADIVVFDSWAAINYYPFDKSQIYVFRTTLHELTEQTAMLGLILPKTDRINIVVTDITEFAEVQRKQYSEFLLHLSAKVSNEYRKDHPVQLNLLTDRMFLDSMNNCNAGWESITLAPDGKFYICPAFYLDGGESVGDLQNGLDVRNPQLYRLDHAPICRNCDAWHCRRCVWLNRKTTLEVNTPSHEQCVVAHLERNASRKLLKSIRELGEFLPGKEIKAIDYLDPFESINK